MKPLLLILLISGCTTEGHVTRDKESSSLKCVGYCDMVITDQNEAINAKAKGKTNDE